MLSCIAFTITRYIENFKDTLYLTKSEEKPEYPLDTWGRPLSVWAAVLSLGTVGGNVILLRLTIQNDIKAEDLIIKSKYISKEKEEKETYLMASLGGRSLESSVTCSSGESTKDKLEILMLGIHLDISIWSWYSLSSSL